MRYLLLSVFLLGACSAPTTTSTQVTTTQQIVVDNPVSYQAGDGTTVQVTFDTQGRSDKVYVESVIDYKNVYEQYNELNDVQKLGVRQKVTEQITEDYKDLALVKGVLATHHTGNDALYLFYRYDLNLLDKIEYDSLKETLPSGISAFYAHSLSLRGLKPSEVKHDVSKLETINVLDTHQRLFDNDGKYTK